MTLEGGNGDRRNERPSFSEQVRQEVGELEVSARKFAADHPETATWLHDHLNKISVRGLQGAFKNVIESVHGTSDPKSIVPPERTYIVKDPHGSAHLAGAGITRIDGSEFVGLEKKLTLTWRAAKLLDLVCHENSHAAGKISVTDSPGMTRREVGYAVQEITDTSHFSTGVLFNEGVTEIISKRVAREYLIGYPMILEDGSVLDVDTYERFLESYNLEHDTHKEYATARDFVRALSTHVATALKTTPELVEDAFIGGYFRGTEEFFGPDFLDDVLGPGFSELLRSAKTADDFEKIVRDYKMPPIKSEVQERIEDMLRKLRDQRS